MHRYSNFYRTFDYEKLEHLFERNRSSRSHLEIVIRPQHDKRSASFKIISYKNEVNNKLLLIPTDQRLQQKMIGRQLEYIVTEHYLDDSNGVE